MTKEKKILLLPDSAGVYLFKNSANIVLYIGKAKSLKKRVASYFSHKITDWKVAELIKQYEVVDYILTYNEHEALLLEAQLINEYKPKFNVLLKNNNPSMYLLFSFKEKMGLSIVRKKKLSEGLVYFGPFLQRKDAKQVYFYLLKVFQLQTCTVKIENGCLEYHLNNCSGTCKSDFNKEDYVSRLLFAQQALEGNKKIFKQSIEKKIQEYSALFEFEKARNLYGYLQNIEHIFKLLKHTYSDKKYDNEVAEALIPSSYQLNDLVNSGNEIKELLHLEKEPIRIDCFDISHFQSNAIVGSCVRFVNGVPAKNKFRKFKIRSLVEQNDYAALQEIVTRRYKDGDYPDLVVIDGGKGQLSAVLSVIPTSLDCVALAKREETIYSRFLPEGIILDRHTKAGTLLIRLRDYTHHFAISYHKRLRAKNFLSK